MYKLKRIKLSLLLFATMLFGTAGLTNAASIDLSSLAFVQYGDGQSYSLNGAITTQCGGSKSGCPYYIQSGPGQIDDLVVVATGPSGQNLVTNFSGMDKAYATPENSTLDFFRTSAATSRGHTGTIAHNGDNTWDSSLTALKSYLSGDNLVFFFNNNQTNNNGGASQSLAAWAQIYITDPRGHLVGTPYDFTNQGFTVQTPGKYALFTEGGGGIFGGSVTNYTSTGLRDPLAGTNASTDYVLSGGQICALPNGAPVSCSTPGAGAPVNNNLGADQAAYAVYFPELNAQLGSLFGSVGNLAEYTLHVDFRIGCDPAILNKTADCSSQPYYRGLDNGYEQLFIGTAAVTRVPEPGSLALLGLGLISLMAFSMRRRTQDYLVGVEESRRR